MTNRANRTFKDESAARWTIGPRPVLTGAERWDWITSPCLRLKIKHRMFCKFFVGKRAKFSDETQLWAAGCFGLCAVFCVQCSVCRAALRCDWVASYAASKSDLEESCITCSVGFILNDKVLQEGWKHRSLSFRLSRNDCKQGRNELHSGSNLHKVAPPRGFQKGR